MLPDLHPRTALQLLHCQSGSGWWTDRGERLPRAMIDENRLTRRVLRLVVTKSDGESPLEAAALAATLQWCGVCEIICEDGAAWLTDAHFAAMGDRLGAGSDITALDLNGALGVTDAVLDSLLHRFGSLRCFTVSNATKFQGGRSP